MTDQTDRPILDQAEQLRRQEARNRAFVDYLRRERITEMVVDSKLFAQAWHALPQLRFSYGRCHGLKINATLVLNAGQLPEDDPLSSAHLLRGPSWE